MTRVLAIVGPETETLIGARRAIAFAREHGAELDLLAVAGVPRPWLGATSVAERREAAARAHLREAESSAVAAGVPPRARALRLGRVTAELNRFADEEDSDVLFLTRVRPRWWSGFLRRPRAELHEITLSRRGRERAAGDSATQVSEPTTVAGSLTGTRNGRTAVGGHDGRYARSLQHPHVG